MYRFQVAAVFVLVAGYAIAAEYKGESNGGYGSSTGVAERAITIAKYVSGGVSEGSAGSFGGGENLPPQRHNFTYHARDEQDTVNFRQEKDQYGSVGDYSDVNGLYGNVEDVAGAGDSRADIAFKDPGVEEDSPDDPFITSEHESKGHQGQFSVEDGRPGDYSRAGTSALSSNGGGVQGISRSRTRRGHAYIMHIYTPRPNRRRTVPNRNRAQNTSVSQSGGVNNGSRHMGRAEPDRRRYAALAFLIIAAHLEILIQFWI